MQFLISAEWVQQEADDAGHQGLRRGGPEVVRGPEEAVLPEGQGLQGVPQDLGHDRGGHPLPRQARPAPAEAHAEGHRGRQEGLRRGDQGVLRQEQEALRPARAPRPPRRPDQDRGQGRTRPRRRSRAARASRTSPRSTRSTRPPRRRAASCPAVAKGQQEKAFDEAIFERREGRARRAPSRPSSAGTSSRSTRSPPASQQTLERGEGDDQEPAQLRRASRRRSTSSSRTSARSTRTRRTARTTTGSPSARTRPKEKTDTGPASGGNPGAPAQQPQPQQPQPAERPPRRHHRRTLVPERISSGRASLRLDEITRRLRARVPLGPRAGRALDRPAHGRGGLRAGRRRPLGRRREAARRARRRALPGLLPVAAARGARPGPTSPRWPTTAARS